MLISKISLEVNTKRKVRMGPKVKWWKLRVGVQYNIQGRGETKEVSWAEILGILGRDLGNIEGNIGKYTWHDI